MSKQKNGKRKQYILLTKKTRNFIITGGQHKGEYTEVINYVRHE